MAGPADPVQDPARRRRTIRAATRALLRFGLPVLGLVVIGRAVVASVGGDIERWRFALGGLLVLAGFLSKLVPAPGRPQATRRSGRRGPSAPR